MRRNACLILRRRHGELVLKIMAPPVLPVRVTCVRVLDVVAHPCLREFSEWPRDLV